MNKRSADFHVFRTKEWAKYEHIVNNNSQLGTPVAETESINPPVEDHILSPFLKIKIYSYNALCVCYKALLVKQVLTPPWE